MNGLPPAAEDAQQHEKQVDEIQVKRQGAHNGSLTVCLGSFRYRGAHVFDLLGIISHQAGENKNPNIGSDPVKGGTIQKQVYQRGDDQANQQHEQQASKPGQVVSGKIPVGAHQRKHAAANKKRRGNRTAGVHQKYNRKRKAVEEGVQKKNSGSGPGGHAVDQSNQGANQQQLADDQSKENNFIPQDKFQHGQGAGRVHGHKTRYGQGKGHPAIYFGNKALLRLCYFLLG